jgi:hypothetical protein
MEQCAAVPSLFPACDASTLIRPPAFAKASVGKSGTFPPEGEGNIVLRAFRWLKKEDFNFFLNYEYFAELPALR